MELEEGVQRWAVDISKWNPSSHDFSLAISSFLPKTEHPFITRFAKLEDRKRALVSRLLQYSLVHQVLGIPSVDTIIRRTAEGKPYLVFDDMELKFPNFNFNVSHHGDYVAIASEPICIVGLDIVSISIPTNETAEDFIRNFSSYFSGSEWSHVINARSSSEMLKIFYKYWCLKEAFVKAIGSGVGYKLDDVEFHHTNWNSITVEVAGKQLKDWKFWLRELGHDHWVAVAKGHPRTAIGSYSRTLKQTEFDVNRYKLGFDLANPKFSFQTVEGLLQVIGHARLDIPNDLSMRNLRTSDDDESVEIGPSVVIPQSIW